MPRSLKPYLEDLLEASNLILQFTAGMEQADYDNNRQVQLAVERCFR